MRPASISFACPFIISSPSLSSSSSALRSFKKISTALFNTTSSLTLKTISSFVFRLSRMILEIFSTCSFERRIFTPLGRYLTATARRMPRPVDGDEGGRMEIEIYLPMQSISPALWAGLLTSKVQKLTSNLQLLYIYNLIISNPVEIPDPRDLSKPNLLIKQAGFLIFLL